MGDQLPVKSPIGSGGQDVGLSGVAQDVALFTSVPLAQWGMRKTPTDGVSLYEPFFRKRQWLYKQF